MASVSAPVRLVNPGKRRYKKGLKNPRKLSLLQKLHFGTKKQRSAAMSAMKRKKNPGRNKAQGYSIVPKRKTARRATKKAVSSTTVSKRSSGGARKKLRYAGKSKKGTYKYILNPRKRKKNSAKRRRKNVGEIVVTKLKNPRKRRVTNMAKTRKKTNRKKYRRNPSTTVTVRRRNTRRRRNPISSRKRHYRRNPGLAATGTTVGGVLLGAAVTKMVVGKLVPANFQVGPVSYVIAAAIAFVQGMLVSKFAKKPALGEAMQLGGYTYVGLKILNDLVPDLATFSPFGLRGALARSSFYTPQVPTGNSFTNFVTPSAVMNAIPPPAPVSMKGVRTGRTN